MAAHSKQCITTKRSSTFQTRCSGPFGPHPHLRHQSTRLTAEHTSILTRIARLTYVHRNLTYDALLCSTKESNMKRVMRDAATNIFFRKSTIATESSNSIRTRNINQTRQNIPNIEQQPSAAVHSRQRTLTKRSSSLQKTNINQTWQHIPSSLLQPNVAAHSKHGAMGPSGPTPTSATRALGPRPSAPLS